LQENRNIYIHNNDLPKDIYLTTNIVAIDTETMGLNLKRDRLCLLQITDGKDIHLIHFTNQEYNPKNLLKILTNNEIVKIFHYARFDICAIALYLKVMCYNVYCTKIASRLVRTYTNKHGLKDICSELLSVEISKEQQSSYWGTDLLTESQKIYAAQDVYYLHDLKLELDKMLFKENRTNIAKACFDFLPVKAHLDIIGFEEEDIFSHSAKHK
jgi:ribonuclease D